MTALEQHLSSVNSRRSLLTRTSPVPNYRWIAGSLHDPQSLGCNAGWSCNMCDVFVRLKRNSGSVVTELTRHFFTHVCVHCFNGITDKRCHCHNALICDSCAHRCSDAIYCYDHVIEDAPPVSTLCR